jgi:hypothetical protein
MRENYKYNYYNPCVIMLWLLTLCLVPAAASSLSVSSSNSNSNSNIPPQQPPSSSSSSPLRGGSSSITQVVSLHKNHGHADTFFFPDRTTGSTLPLLPNQQQPRDSSSHRRHRRPSLARSIQSAIRSTFLPAGYPKKTPPNYLQYCCWSWIQDLTTQLRSVLATQRILEGVGVGRQGATALSALLNFLVRDGCGMVASLLFTSMAASRFRANVKQWRLFADIMVDIGITMEVMAVQLPTALFLPMISVGNMCKAICGVAAGACGGAIHVHWAKGGSDISDIQAKFGAQNIVAGSIGLVASAVFAKSASTVKGQHLWLLYGWLTMLHIFANMRCMRLLAFDTFNVTRLRLVAADFFTKSAVDAYSEQSLTPGQVSKMEPLFFFSPKPVVSKSILPAIPIHFGVSFAEYARQSKLTMDELRVQLERQPSYFIAIGSMKRQQRRKNSKPCIVVALNHDASAEQQVKAFFHALVLTEAVASSLRRGASLNEAEDLRRLEMETVTRVDGHLWKNFSTQCKKAGWDLTSNQLQSKGYEVVVTAD